MAWGQDFVLIDSKNIKTATWTRDRPYLVSNQAIVDSDQTLTIEAGTSVYFHKNTGLMVKGTLNVLGTYEEPVGFQEIALNRLTAKFQTNGTGSSLLWKS